MRSTITRGLMNLMLVITLFGGCDRGGRTRSALDDHRDGWARRLSVLRTAQAEQEARLRALPAAPETDRAAVVQRMQLEASVAGLKQALYGVEAHIDGSSRDVEAALANGNDQGRDALDAVRARIADYFNAQEQQLVSTASALAAAATTTPAGHTEESNASN
jgi:hypothetical protein